MSRQELASFNRACVLLPITLDDKATKRLLYKRIIQQQKCIFLMTGCDQDLLWKQLVTATVA